MFSKKGIGAVVSTSLLIVLVVSSIVGFQTWFSSYSSGMYTKAETESNKNSMNSMVDRLVDNILYFKNGYDNLTITEIRLDGNICMNTSANYSKGILEFDLSSCVNKSSISNPTVVLLTNKGIFDKTVVIVSTLSASAGDSSPSQSLDCSSLEGGEWVLVPGNLNYGTTDFCVMKYEAKQNGSNATSTYFNLPWTGLTQAQAKTACINLGSGYDIITNSQWMTIARNIEQVSSNWNNGIVGSGFIFSGHDDNNPSSSLQAHINDSDGYYGTLNVDGSNQKRTLMLQNGEVIWDLSGNVWEWTNDTLSMHNWDEGGISHYWNFQTNETFRLNAGPSNSSWGSSQGVGYVTHSSTQSNGIIRGGWWNFAGATGLYAIDMNNPVSATVGTLGFRCVYNP